MSTKIWTAYKLDNRSNLWSLVHDIRLKATANVTKKFYELHEKLLSEVDVTSAKYLKLRESHNDTEARRLIARSCMFEGYKLATVSSLHDPFNFDVSVGFRELNGSIFIIPYCDWLMKDVLTFLSRDKRLKDFHYQNQADQPKHISNHEWKHRSNIWNAMDSADKWKDVLVLDICRLDMFWQIDPWTFRPTRMRSHRDRKRTHTSG